MTRHHPVLIAIGALTLSIAACGGSSATSPTPPLGATNTPVRGGSLPALAVDSSLLEILNADIQDEYRAAAIYQGVLLSFGAGTRPFANVISAERTHAASVGALFTARGLPVPVSLWSEANVPRFATLPAACTAAVQAELENIALYDSQLGLSLPEDVMRVLQNNRAASLNNHLPAFKRCQ